MKPCASCNTPTTNGIYLGAILCDECIEELDKEIDRRVDEYKTKPYEAFQLEDAYDFMRPL